MATSKLGQIIIAHGFKGMSNLPEFAAKLLDKDRQISPQVVLNANVTDGGVLEARGGYRQTVALANCHSVAGEERGLSVMLCVADGITWPQALYRVEGDQATELCEVTGPQAQVNYAEIDNVIYVSNPHWQATYDLLAGTVSSWGVPLPPAPDIALVAGDLPPGTYFLCYTNVVGNRHGGNGPLVKIKWEGGAQGILLRNLPTGALCWITQPNGKELFLAPVFDFPGMAIVFDSGVPDSASGMEISAYLAANPFTLALPQTITNIRFWAVAAEGYGDPDPGIYHGSIVWQIYDADNGQPGNLLFSGEVEPIPVFSHETGWGKSYQFDFSIPSTFLAAGNYWLALHNGSMTEQSLVNFYWESSQLGQVAILAYAQAILPGGTWGPWTIQDGVDYAMAFQLLGQCGVVSGQSPWMKPLPSFMVQPPPGFSHFIYAFGRIWGGLGKRIYYSDPGQYEWFRPANFLPFLEDVVLVAPVTGGLFVSSLTNTWYLEGTDPAKMKSTWVGNGAIPGTLTMVQVPASVAGGAVTSELFGKFSKMPTPIWMAPTGFVVGSHGGNLTYLTENKMNIQVRTQGAGLYRLKNGIPQVILSLFGLPEGASDLDEMFTRGRIYIPAPVEVIGSGGIEISGP